MGAGEQFPGAHGGSPATMEHAGPGDPREVGGPALTNDDQVVELLPHMAKILT